MLAPAIVRPVARACCPALDLVFANEGRLAEGNLTRQPGRAALTASAMLIGLAIVVAAIGLPAGLALGYALTALMAATMTTQMRYSFPAAGLVAAVAAGLLIAVLASLLPARQTTGVTIVQSLHYE